MFNDTAVEKSEHKNELLVSMATVQKVIYYLLQIASGMSVNDQSNAV